MTNPGNQETIYGYDNALRLVQTTLLAPDPDVVATSHFERDGNENDLLTYISQTTYDDQGTQKVITSKQRFDGSGRVIRAGTGTGADPGSYDTVATVYDGWGRPTKQSNPYLGDADGNGDNQFWTVNDYDELSRVRTVTLPGNGNQTVQTNYNGAVTTVTDTVGRKRRSEMDGLGRLVKVTEQNPANGNLEWETTYSYDALDNLTRINQGGQIRTFIYDAKGRLRTETTPESGTTTYDYTPFDAVSKRTDQRRVVTEYTYGPLNLLTGVRYNTAGAPGVIAPADVTIGYNTEGPDKAKIKNVTYADETRNESYGYDSLGRLASRTQEIDNINYKTQYEYNALGRMTLMIYPSGKRVKVDRDARGRLAKLKKVDDSGNPQGPSYLSGVVYRADGLISRQDLGDGTVEEFGYSADLLQLTSQSVKKGENTLLSLRYGYDAVEGKMGSGSRAGNSGQVVSVTGTISGQNRNQTFTYDNVGRLVTATGLSIQGSTQVPWARRYAYDQYGNRTAEWDAVSGGAQLQSTMIEKVSAVETNRIASVNGTTFYYDASGNLTDDGVREYMYDAENRIVGVRVKVSGLSESYDYDAANHRVKKMVGGVVTHYIWEGDQVIAEYERGGNTSATGTRYYHQDGLSPRVITDGDGNVVGTTDHLPFGEEIGLSGQGEKHKFTTYERDGTGLDYAVNRHYNPQQGRFNQADPLGIGAASLVDPQSLNLYSYVRNDPVNSVDPSGLVSLEGGTDPTKAHFGAGLGGLVGGSGFIFIETSTSTSTTTFGNGALKIGDEITHFALDRFTTITVTTTIYTLGGGWVGFGASGGGAPVQRNENRRTEEESFHEAGRRLTGPCNDFYERLIQQAANLARIEYPNGAPGIRPPFEAASTFVLNLYWDAMQEGRVSSSGQSGATQQSDGSTYIKYGVTTNFRAVSWNNEFYDLDAGARGRHTLHEALHQVAGFTDSVLAEAARIVTNGPPIGNQNPSEYLNNRIAERCR